MHEAEWLEFVGLRQLLELFVGDYSTGELPRGQRELSELPRRRIPPGSASS
jgi:hypothetical protein